MRKFIIILLLAFSTTLYSCFNLDVTPENSVTFDSYFKNENDIKIFMNGIKSDFRSVCINNAHNFQIKKGMYSDVTNDYLILWVKGLQPFIYGDNVMSFSWQDIYKMIQSCNVLMEQIHNANLPKEVEDLYVGRAYFYRAYGYFYIAQTWGDAPIVTNSRDVEMRGKSSYLDIIAQSVSDTQEALKRIPNFRDLIEEGTKATSKESISKETVYALQAHVYAWEASVGKKQDSWALSIAAANELLKSKDYFDLAGSPEELCAQTLKGTSHKESIFEVDMGFYDGFNTEPYPFTPAFFVTGFPVDPKSGVGDIRSMNAVVTNATVDIMFPKGDTRREAYFYKTDEYRDDESISFTKNYAFPYKFRYPYLNPSGTDKGEMIAFDQRRILFRVADIILLRAEAYANIGDKGSAVNDINTIRSRASAKLYNDSEYDGDIKMAVFKEREKELLWESHRYFDIVRNGYFTMVSTAFGRLTPKNIEDGAFYLPVFKLAFTDCPMMTQNKYWLSKY